MNDFESEVQTAYRWILGRSADPTGIEHYTGCLRSGSLDSSGLRRSLIESPEFTGGLPGYVVADIGNGLKAVVDPSEPEFGRHIVAGGGWEPHVVEAIRSNLGLGQTFVDIGGNVGVMSFNAAAVVGARGKVIAFEPNPRNVSAFRRGIVANGNNNILLLSLALSDHHHMIGLTSASNAKVLGDASATQVADVVQAVPGDEILEHQSQIDLIKIDIEGYELPALMGLQKTLVRHKPKILCEFNPLCLRAQGGIEPNVLADFLFELTAAVEVVEHDNGRTVVSSSADLMRLWEQRDSAATAAGHLPAGWAHLDLLLSVS